MRRGDTPPLAGKSASLTIFCRDLELLRERGEGETDDRTRSSGVDESKGRFFWSKPLGIVCVVEFAPYLWCGLANGKMSCKDVVDPGLHACGRIWLVSLYTKPHPPVRWMNPIGQIVCGGRVWLAITMRHRTNYPRNWNLPRAARHEFIGSEYRWKYNEETSPMFVDCGSLRGFGYS